MRHNSNDALTYFPLISFNLVNQLFHTSICWKWSASCHVCVKWHVGQNQLDHADLNYTPAQPFTCDGPHFVVVCHPGPQLLT